MSLTAQFNTLCGACEEWIRPGDDIQVSPTGTTHADCDPHVVVENLKAPCDKCWQIPACNGLCGCDE